ncbi:hypothetical protein Tdes44962_MAKER07056 [Teratosphaeria destructans]|uniref:Uncharacterized protein n=1 Tax=Teratosphaeria destructans TaxID=418781 RepID=A0A9W7W6G9_9PEZI|nr:hypothetical protein Tdes44962_MAKER07056 [Teratosphaeria destructans]
MANVPDVGACYGEAEQRGEGTESEESHGGWAKLGFVWGQYRVETEVWSGLPLLVAEMKYRMEQVTV